MGQTRRRAESLRIVWKPVRLCNIICKVYLSFFAKRTMLILQSLLCISQSGCTQGKEDYEEPYS